MRKLYFFFLISHVFFFNFFLGFLILVMSFQSFKKDHMSHFVYSVQTLFQCGISSFWKDKFSDTLQKFANTKELHSQISDVVVVNKNSVLSAVYVICIARDDCSLTLTFKHDIKQGFSSFNFHTTTSHFTCHYDESFYKSLRVTMSVPNLSLLTFLQIFANSHTQISLLNANSIAYSLTQHIHSTLLRFFFQFFRLLTNFC